MSHARQVFAVALVAVLAWAVAPVAEAQPPIRIGASLAQTGVFSALGQSNLRGYQLCVKYMNADLSCHSAGRYGGCLELRDAMLKLGGPHGRSRVLIRSTSEYEL